jgi:Ca2+-binding RTX toxin-like protein
VPTRSSGDGRRHPRRRSRHRHRLLLGLPHGGYDLAEHQLLNREGSDTFLGVENLLGSSKADTLTGSAANNKLTGGGGADTLKGEDGDDTVNSKDGVNGNDSLDGGGSTDTKVTDATEKSIVNFP